jgi:hypothetical protein
MRGRVERVGDAVDLSVSRKPSPAIAAAADIWSCGPAGAVVVWAGVVVGREAADLEGAEERARGYD